MKVNFSSRTDFAKGAPVDLDAVTENQLEDMKDELAYQYLYCHLGDSEATFDATLLPEWICDCWGK